MADSGSDGWAWARVLTEFDKLLEVELGLNGVFGLVLHRRQGHVGGEIVLGF